MRVERHKRKKRFRKVFAILFILLLSVVGYIYIQYRSGIAESLKLTDSNQQEFEFNGKKDQYGGINILLLGSDTYEKERSRADTIMIVHYNKDKGTYKITSIMRDTYVEIPGHGKNKINAALALGGPELMRKTIKNNFNLDIQHYAMVNFEGFVHVVDELFPDGVKVNVEKKIVESPEMTIEPGIQKLDGKHLLAYVRFRRDAEGDFGRVKRQQEVIKTIANEMTSIHGVTKMPKLVGMITPFINTNLNTGNMIFIGKDYFLNKDQQIESFRIPVDGTYTDKRVSAGAVLDIDLNKNKEALHEFIQK
ncbi:LCP family protein [Bacillus aquiflavi]|uniref:Regulatory protein MsrR n=1 Tax=Bacillus aquiflavi TaxID=2672567 RepID=A0A6B3VXL6_9BACI|nr:LCP family protein [Bacillus aquiflavi]MBA4535708.1 LCP family protein [Bacillus aquiflavi]NEY80084.1 LCP family protein [Bacillus aquiflavi]UAC49012.1 LCP family protein [Bacillus aquiflavi]